MADHDAGDHEFRLSISGVPLTEEQEQAIRDALTKTFAQELAKLDFEGDRKALDLATARTIVTAGAPT